MTTKVTLELEPQAVTDLMRLVSIAAWIRSEQLADIDHRRLLGANDVKELEPQFEGIRPLVPVIVLDPHLLVVDKARGDLLAAQEWWTKLKRLSESMQLPETPSWWNR